MVVCVIISIVALAIVGVKDMVCVVGVKRVVSIKRTTSVKFTKRVRG